MANVFISYAREDRDLAQSIARALEAWDWTVWWDREILGGENFDEVIERELEQAGCVIVLWSRHSVASNWVRSEAAVAAERGVLVPAFAENVKLPLEFRRKHTIDLTAWRGDPRAPEFSLMCRAIAAHLHRGIGAGEGLKSEMSSKSTHLNRRKFFFYFGKHHLVIAGVVLALVVGVLQYSDWVRNREDSDIGGKDAAVLDEVENENVIQASEGAQPVPSTSDALGRSDEEPHEPGITRHVAEDATERSETKSENVGQAGQDSAKAERIRDRNVIRNGGFEEVGSSGEPLHWKKESWVNGGEMRLATTSVKSGVHAAVLACNSPNHLRWVQDVVLRQETSCTLSGWVRTDSVAHSSESDNRGASLAVRWNNGSGVKYIPSQGVLETSDGWKLLTLNFKTEVIDVVTVMLQLGGYYGTTSGVAWFDDIRLECSSQAGDAAVEE